MGAEEALYDDEDFAEPDIVEWYEARPMTVSTVVATGSVVAAFALGALAAAGFLAMTGRLDD